MPQVSIGLPIYNKPQYLEESIDSLLAQTFTDFEILISDNASPDPKIKEICERYVRRDPRIQYIRHPANIGPVENFCYVYEKTNAPFFMWAADDDLWEPQFIERGVKALSSDPSKSAWFSQFDSIDSEGKLLLTYPPVSRVESRGKKRLEVLSFLMDARKHNKKAMVIYSLFRREALTESVALMRQNGYMRGADHVFAYAFICRHDLLTGSETLFHKREIKQVRDYSKSNPYNFLENKHFAGFSRAAAGTPYHSMTLLMLPVRYFFHQIHKIAKSKRLARNLNQKRKLKSFLG
jgi:glycosyltransferase involved in cell wall biosynthesis